MTELSNTEINKLVAEKLGLLWHEEISVPPRSICSCGQNINSAFCSNAKVLLDELEKKGLLQNFAWKLNNNQRYGCAQKMNDTIPIKYILNPRLLCEECLEWEK